MKRSPRATGRGRLGLAAVFVGNALEWFDIVIFGYFAAVIGTLFFPGDDPAAALLFAFATFGVTFLVRPLGAVVIGSYADRHGRKAALLLCAALMTGATALIAVLPPYATIGLAAPALLVVARLAQGFSAGGEFGGATAYLAEQDRSRRGFYASLQFSSQGLTALLATGFGTVLSFSLTPQALIEWGWRIPFVFGALIGPVAYLIRLHALESPEFRPQMQPLQRLIAHDKMAMSLAVGAVVFGTVVTYFIVYLPTYSRIEFGFAPQLSFTGGLVTALILLCGTPLAGALSDRIGRVRPMLTAAFFLCVLIYPLLTWFAAAPGFGRLITLQIVIGILAAAYLGPLAALMAVLFPAAVRGSGLAISYALGVSVFGGFAPFINAGLITLSGDRLAPAFYVMAAGIISGASLMVLARRS